MREVKIVAIGMEAGGAAPMMLLRPVNDPHRVLPIWIGIPEASAVETERQRIPAPRPTTHRLLAAIVEAFGRRVERVCITALRDNVFHAELVFDPQSGPATPTTISARPSDAVALALHLEVPIMVDEAVLEHAALPAAQIVTNAPGGEGTTTLEPGEDETDPDPAEIDRFREFLDQVDPGDFERGGN